MVKAVTHTVNYFRAPADYFWRWAEMADVVEWRSGSTFFFRDDLILLFREFAGQGFPPMGPLLLVLFACHKEVTAGEEFFLTRTLKRFEDASLGAIFDKALRFLQIINALPDEIKKGSARRHLVHEVFERNEVVFSKAQMKAALDELGSGRIDHLIVEPGEAISKEQFSTELHYLSKALDRYPTVQALELKLRTGLSRVPSQAAIELPQLRTTDLIGQLEQDPETLGIARLAKRLTSALNIPMHSQGSGDQSYGGISDITNRGNYDKLLLSELAHDDLSLMARLVNNEALYFRREEPPESPKRKRTILFDVTLKMWGIPRVFALSAGLAFALNSKHGEIIEAYALGGEQFTELDLATKEGIIHALGILQHSLHCGRALEALVNELHAPEQNEYILITEAKLLNSPEFHASLQHVREFLSFIITVSRSGDLQFYECIKGKARLLSNAKLDMDELLFEPVQSEPFGKGQNDQCPAFFVQQHSPLLFPKVRIKREEGKFLVVQELGLIVVNESQRLLLIKSKDKGATELLNFIENGVYTFGLGEGNDLYVLVSNYQRRFLKVYRIDVHSLSVSSYDLSDGIEGAKEAAFDEMRFYIRTEYVSFQFDCHERRIIGKKGSNGYDAEIAAARSKRDMPRVEQLGRYLDGVWYSTMHKIKELFVGDAGQLCIGHYNLSLAFNDSIIKIAEKTTLRIAVNNSHLAHGQLRLLPNKHIKLNKRTWMDGSIVIVDSRGLLHLKSSDQGLPEITIVLVTGVQTACWASDGVACGSSYFIEESMCKIVPAGEFYKKYIQPFIDRLT